MSTHKKMVCFDSQSCLKCFACVAACGIENRIRLQRDKNVDMFDTINETDTEYLNFLKVKQSESGKFPNVKYISTYNHCRHCEKPACTVVCPTNALKKEEEGMVTLNRDVCVGCEACVNVCPYNVPKFNDNTGKTYKCFMCTDRLNAGLKTACADACVSVAIFSGDADEVMAEAQKRAKNYTEKHGIEYFVYGDGSEDLPVGKLGYITIAPKQDREAYDLPVNPTNTTFFKARQAVKYGTAAVAGAMVVGIAGHVMHYKKNKANESKED